jgi:hypothetical protein
VQAWIDVLESVEQGVDACERRYILGEAVEMPPAPTLPELMQPLPPELEARARSVLARLSDIESKVARIPRPGAPVRSARFGGAERATATFDHRM